MYSITITPVDIRMVSVVGEEVETDFNTYNPITIEVEQPTWANILFAIERDEGDIFITRPKRQAFIVVTVLDGVLLRTSLESRSKIERWAKR